MTFTWADKNSSEIKLPSYENKELEARFEEVYKVFQTSFHESIVKMNSCLKSYGVKICKTKLTDNNGIKPHYLNSRYICNLLNSPNAKVVSMHSNAYASVSINVKGRLLLYAICQLYRCRIMLFSTRSKAVIIHPSNTDQSDQIPCFYILQHKDSYIHETTYFFLKSTKTPVPNPTGLQVQNQNSPTKVAIKREAGEKKAKKDRHKLGKKLDEMIVNLLKEEVQSMYDKKWRQFLIKNSNTASSSSGESSLLNRFGATLSKKQLPTGVVPLVKQKIELMLHNNEVEGMSGGDIPKSAMWLYNKIQHFKEQNLINIHDLANNFLERVEHNTNNNVNNQSSSRNISDQESTEEKVMIKAADTEEEKKKKDTGYRTVGKTLKSVINSKFDYDILRERLDMLQITCRKSIAGLSKAIETLIEILFSGKVGQDNSATAYDIFKLDDIDFNNQNIGKGEQDIALLSNITLKSLEEADLFSYAGFWTIMSKCIGKKFVDKKNNSYVFHCIFVRSLC